MAQRFAVILSDIHIGSNRPTCWYQKSVHEQNLSTVLTWLVQRKKIVREVLFLGDMFDTWTYPPSERPPTMSQIIAANPDLLGPRGPLAELVKALPGQVRVMLGNHDLSVTRADIETLNRSLLGAAGGRGIVFDPATWRVLWGARSRTVFSHGHHWCMFNAPDPISRWNRLPIGYFITRAISYNVAKRLSRLNVANAALLPGHGNPTRTDWLAILAAWERDRGRDLADFLLTYMCQSLGMPLTEPILMPDGSTTNCVEAARVFAGLFTRWVKKENGYAQNALRAAKADWRGNDLAWFAQRLALQTGSDLAVMGHTHKPIRGLKVAPANYVNSGYECVAVPDKDDRFTFTAVDLERAVAELLTVTGGRVTPTTRDQVSQMDSAILSPLQDYSCYVGVLNPSPRPLRLVNTSKDPASYWVVPPPHQIDAKAGRTAIWLSDTLGPHGSDGSFTYTDGVRMLEFSFSCPYLVYSNKVSSPVPVFETKVGDAGRWSQREVEGRGHPLQVRFYVDPAPVPAGAPATRPGGQLPAPAPGGGQGQGGGPQHELAEYEFPEIAAARAVLQRAGAPRWRGEVLCLAHLRPGDGSPLLDPTTEPSPTGERLKNPLNHVSSRDVQSIALPDGRVLRYVWISPSVSVSYAGGMLFLPNPGSLSLTLVTLNVSSLDSDFKHSCDNGHHSEMQLVGFIDRQSAAWRRRLGSLAVHNRSRRGSGWGYSACNACCAGLASFLQRLGSMPRSAPVRASISWERLYAGRASCGHPTDADHIRNLVASGWSEPMGPRPAGTEWPTPTPIRRRLASPAPAESRW
jgi:UDP-2,3-diacylglucosamine pyrophosphatase LpxH